MKGPVVIVLGQNILSFTIFVCVCVKNINILPGRSIDALVYSPVGQLASCSGYYNAVGLFFFCQNNNNMFLANLIFSLSQ